MSIEVDKLGETEFLDPVIQETAENQRVKNAALQALEVPTIEAKPIDLITKKQGILWRCIGVTINPIGGKIYHYKLKDEYACQSTANKKQAEIFPANEPSSAEEISFSEELQQIGYRVKSDETGIYLDLPDLEAIVAGYEKLREAHPELPRLRIVSNEGIADDLTFCRAYPNYDLLLSDGIEFVHDSISHTSRVLQMMISSPAEYVITKERNAKSIQKHLETLDRSQASKTHLLQATTLLGAAIDIIWAAPTMIELKIASLDEMDENVLDIWSDHDFQNYWMKIYQVTINRSIAMGIWTAVG